MKYAFKKINIEAPFPTRQCGHSCQTYELSEFHDHLFARAIGFKDENNFIIHLSMDLLAFDLKHRNLLQDYLRNYYHDDNLHLITSTTHTHYANDVRNEKYQEYLHSLLCEEIVKMEYKEVSNVETTYQRLHTTAVGKSRISGYELNNEYLCLIRFYESNNNFLNIVYYNCHPTILKADTKFFSAEYPGYVLRKLEEKCPGIDFSFMQGAAGDISSRFVRVGQTYEDVEKLGNYLLNDINNLMKQEVKKVPLNIKYNEKLIEYKHEFTPIDLSKIRNDLSDREKETIRIGQEQRLKLEKASNPLFGKLIDEAIIASLDLNSVKIKFFPNEIFSHYMNYLDLDKEMLVSYSNGYGPYVLPIDFEYITYEMFTDTLTKDTKEKIIETLKTI